MVFTLVGSESSERKASLSRLLDDAAHDEQGSRLLAVLSVVSEGLIIRDREGLMVSCGDATPALLGLTREELSDATSPEGWMMLDSAGRSVKQEPMSGRATLNSGEAQPAVTVRVQLPDGSLRSLELKTMPVRRPTGVLAGVTIALRDVSEAQTLLDLARMHEARADALLEDMTDGAFELDLVTGRTAQSLRLSQIFGLTAVELHDHPEDWNRFIHPDDLPTAKTAWQAIIGGRKNAFDVEYRMRHRDGRWLWINAKARVTRFNLRGLPLWVTGSMTDVTRRHEAEATVMQLREELAQLRR